MSKPTILNNIQALENFKKKHAHKVIGLVPTMGNLHRGHLSLVERISNDCDIIIVSIFVNPAQFSPQEDYDSYPRTLEKDISLLSNTPCHAVFTPTTEEIYPPIVNPLHDLINHPEIETLATVLCGVSRPHFFYGVIKVVCRLFDLVEPSIACFGEKDYQQLLIVRRVTQKLFSSITILSAPIERNEHGLALSSRNNYLNAQQLDLATTLTREIKKTIHSLQNCQTDTEWQSTLEATRHSLQQFFDVDYFEVRSEHDLEATSLKNSQNSRLFAAVYLQNVRLLDNQSFVC